MGNWGLPKLYMHSLAKIRLSLFPEPDYNFALQKPTAQSNTHHVYIGTFSSHYAVDGIKAPSCIVDGLPACAHLATTSNQWWRVDLLVKNFNHRTQY
jgi:hypothetical protein